MVSLSAESLRHRPRPRDGAIRYPPPRNSGSGQSILKHTFGYDSFRGFQQQVIDHVVGGGDALVLMPTGKMLKELKEASRRLLDIIQESDKGAYRAKGFTGLRGKLPWPADGKVAIPYGSSKDPQFNTPVFRSGIFIQTGNDTVAKAVHAGKVAFAEWFKGYGQLMIVTHGNGYHTLYGSLSEIFSKVGDIINSGQVIGRVGDSSVLNAPGLYFEVRYKGKPLDPVQWLRKR